MTGVTLQDHKNIEQIAIPITVIAIEVLIKYCIKSFLQDHFI